MLQHVIVLLLDDEKAISDWNAAHRHNIVQLFVQHCKGIHRACGQFGDCIR